MTKTEEVTSIEDWKGGDIPLTTLPSGKKIKIKAPGMQAFLASGRIPNSLMGIVKRSIEAAQKGPKAQAKVEEELGKEFAEMMTDPSKLTDIILLADSACIAAFVQPRLFPVPPDPGPEDDPTDPKFQRREELLYVDEVDLEDRFFVFNFAVGGTKNLETFRGQLGGSMESLPTGAKVVKPTKSTGRTTKRKS